VAFALGLGLGIILLVMAVSTRRSGTFREQAELNAAQPGSEPRVDEPERKPRVEEEENILPDLALASVERLEKLKAVRLTAKVSFTGKANVNDVMVMWSWDPTIMVRYEEVYPEHVIAQFAALPPKRQEKVLMDIVKEEKASGGFDEEATRRLEAEARDLLKKRDFKGLLNLGGVTILEEGKVYQLFNSRLALQVAGDQVGKTRNFMFAMCVSSLLPLRRKTFRVERGDDVQIKGNLCSHFRVREAQGTKLDFYFDKQTDLLIKIGYWGNPRKKSNVFREYYFSGYRETNGIKMWRKLEALEDGKEYAVFEVTSVIFSAVPLPELRSVVR
jgi:hypothetical protein